MGRVGHQEVAVKKFIADVRAAVLGRQLVRQDYFDVYANEAIFGFSVIRDDLSLVPQDAVVLEVGAGALLLSGYLASLGLRVHAVEPIAPGFSHFYELQSAVLKYYEQIGLQLRLIEASMEDFIDPERYDFIFSINVFEHILDVERALANAYRSLTHRGALRIYCPNYHFPYEPHFNIPTLLSKKLTGYIFKHLIRTSLRVPQAKETWDGLNWINVTQVKRLFDRHFQSKPIFNRLATYQIVTRVLDDRQFNDRRSKWMILALRSMDRAGLLNVFKCFPVHVSPVMDFRVERVAVKGYKKVHTHTNL